MKSALHMVPVQCEVRRRHGRVAVFSWEWLVVEKTLPAAVMDPSAPEPLNRQKMRHLDSFHRAFTLLELLVVFAVISLLTGMLLPALNQARARGPSRIFVFAEDHQETIDAGAFPFGSPWWSEPSSGFNDGLFWDDFPADRHGNGCNFSFADGHVDHWRWKWKRGVHRPTRKPSVSAPVNPLDMDDLRRLELALPDAP